MVREIIVRTKQQRKDEILKIIQQLSHLQLTISYQPIKNLYVLFKKYIDEGIKIKINIAFPMINRRIKGLLATSVREDVWIKLEHEKF